MFQKDVRTINEHLQNIYDEGELDPSATIRKYRIVRREGTREVAREIEHYNLDAILAVGYRVRSGRGTQFRRWATERLREYLVKGFTMDDQRLKNPPVDGSGRAGLLRRDAGTHPRHPRQREADVPAGAGNLRPGGRLRAVGTKETIEFFQTIQNKLHFAATGKTAPELIAGRADHTKPNMGLTTWKGGVVRKTDVTMAKNYLNQDEISRIEPHRDDVAGLCRGPGAAAQAGFHEGLGDQSWTSSCDSTNAPCCGGKGAVSRGRCRRPRRSGIRRSLRRAAGRCWKRKPNETRLRLWKKQPESFRENRRARGLNQRSNLCRTYL